MAWGNIEGIDVGEGFKYVLPVSRGTEKMEGRNFLNLWPQATITIRARNYGKTLERLGITRQHSDVLTRPWLKKGHYDRLLMSI